MPGPAFSGQACRGKRLLFSGSASELFGEDGPGCCGLDSGGPRMRRAAGKDGGSAAAILLVRHTAMAGGEGGL